MGKIVAIVSEENKEGLIQQFISRYGEKGKKVLVLLVRWLILTFMSGLMKFYIFHFFLLLGFLLQQLLRRIHYLSFL